MPSAYVTTRRRAALALLISAMVGPVLLVFTDVAFHAVQNPASVDLSAGLEFFTAMATQIAASAFFFAPLLLVAGFLTWLVLDLTGRRTWAWLVAAGALLGFAIGFWLKLALYIPAMRYTEGYPDGIVFDYSGAIIATPTEITAYGWRMAAINSIPSLIACALVGFVIWRIAYRRVTNA